MIVRVLLCREEDVCCVAYPVVRKRKGDALVAKISEEKEVRRG